MLGQIGNRVQHALRAYTPKDQKDLRAAAQSFRVNPAFDTEEVLQALGTGEALVSVLDEDGVPSIVERANILPPHSAMNAVGESVLQTVINGSPLAVKYNRMEDRYSAFEEIAEMRREEEAEAAEAARQAELEKERKAAAAKKTTAARKTTTTRKTSSRSKQTPLEKAINTTVTTIGRELGKQIVRGLFGNMRR